MVEDTPKQQTKEEWEAGRRKHVQDHIAEAMVNGDTVWLNLHGKKRKDDLSVEGYCRREGDNYEILAMNKKQQIMAVTIGVNNVNPSNFGYEGDRENAQVKVYAPSEEGYQERLDRIANSGMKSYVGKDVVQAIDDGLEQLIRESHEEDEDLLSEDEEEK